MPVPVPLYSAHSAHQITKPRLDSFDSFASRVHNPALVNGPNYVIHRQESAQQAYDSQGFRPLIHQDLSHCIGDRLNSAIHLVESQHPSRTAVSQHGLTPAADAGFSQQEHAEACSSPARGSARSSMTISSHHGASSDKAWSGYDAFDGMHSATYAADMKGWGAPGTNGAFAYGHESSFYPAYDGMNHAYGCDVSQHPTTPFADFVDRIVAPEATFAIDQAPCNLQQSHQLLESPTVQHKRSAPTDPLTNPSYIKEYRTMAEPLSEWIATYIWKACTSDTALSQRFGSSPRLDLSPAASTVLVKSINNVLCSTLLQPSAIVLALWYISRLPISFEDHAGLELSSVQAEFRNTLFGELSTMAPAERQNELRRRAPFRIALLGFMLANKWLDDHTFSNKTWQSVSEEPIQAINRLEFAALAVLQHDLSVTPKAWEAWLFHLQHYQASNCPYPSPIGRPSGVDANILTRKMVADLISLQKERLAQGIPAPLFSSLLQCQTEKEDLPLTHGSFDPFDIDLDEDGPLKDEYVPKRRPSLLGPRASSDRHSLSLDLKDMSLTPASLPPPSEWSPQGDPPVHSELRGRSSSITRSAPGHGRSFSAAFAPPPSWNAQADVAQAKGLIYPGFPTQSKVTPTWPPFGSQARSTTGNNVSAFPPPYGAIAQPIAWAVPPDSLYGPMHGCGRVADQPPPYSHMGGELHSFRPLWLRT